VSLIGQKLRNRSKVAFELILAVHALVIVVPLALAVVGFVVPLVFVGSSVAVAFAVGLTLGVASVTLFAIRSSQVLTRGYRLRKSEHVYEVLSTPDHYRHRVVFDIEVTRPYVNTVEYRYRWSGGGDHQHLTCTGGRLLGPVLAEGYRYHYIALGRDLLPGDKREIVLQHDLVDTAKTFQPYLATTVKESIDRLILRVKFPEETNWDDQKASITAVRQLGLGGPVKGNLVPTFDDLHKEAAVVVQRPKFGSTYLIRWEPA
jgi:hypothetical protein